MNNSNQFIFTLIFFLFMGLILNGQEFESPEITKPDIKQHIYGSPIEYYLPDTVNQIINSYIDQSNDSLLFYYIETICNDSSYEFFVYSRKNHIIVDSTSHSELLLSSTNRFCFIDNRYIPIYFESDQIFGYYNFTMTSTALVITLERKSYRKFVVSSVYLSN